MEAILFYIEDDTSIPNQRTMIDAWCAMAGMTHIMVDKTGLLKQTNGNIFSSIDEAISAFPDHEFVFMSEKSSKLLSEYIHPAANVIYCVGSDTDGYQSLDLSLYKSYKLDTTTKVGNEWYAASIVPMVIADRMLRG